MSVPADQSGLAVRAAETFRLCPIDDAIEPEGRNKVLLAMLYSAGLRVSELCGLRWRNLQARGDAGQILIHGNGGVRAPFCSRRECGASLPP